MQYATQSVFKFTLADKGIEHGVDSLFFFRA
ncbi:MAG: hypothetical protein H6Q13_3576 [Bacteroidetes bacterium]|nr:hypothetical protein [Bacteroidota bacterium]